MRLLAVAALVAALASSCTNGDDARSPRPSVRTTSAPRDFGIESYAAEPRGSGLCGEYSVVWQPPNTETGTRSILTAVKGGDVALDLKGKDEFEQLTALWCGDVNGDGRREIATQRYTGGAHCCSHVRIDTLDGPTLLDTDLGNAGDPKAQQLDDEGPYEIVTFSDVLAYFEDIPYAASPTLPLVFAYKEGRYVEATSDFPAHVRKSLDDAKQDLAAAVDRKEDEQAIRGMAIGVYGHYVLLNEDESGLDDVASIVSDDVAQWVRDNAEAAVALIRGERSK